MVENIVIFYNDGIDSDNMAGALALMRAMKKELDTRVIWILEPRQVSLGLATTPEQQSQCQGLIERHFPTRGRPFKVLLGGLLDDSDVDGIKGLTKNEQEIVSFKGVFSILSIANIQNPAPVSCKTSLWPERGCHAT